MNNIWSLIITLTILYMIPKIHMKIGIRVFMPLFIIMVLNGKRSGILKTPLVHLKIIQEELETEHELLLHMWANHKPGFILHEEVLPVRVIINGSFYILIQVMIILSPAQTGSYSD